MKNLMYKVTFYCDTHDWTSIVKLAIGIAFWYFFWPYMLPGLLVILCILGALTFF